MSRGSRLMGLAIAVALLAGGVANKASAGPGACKPVQACTPVTTAPAVPVCKPVKPCRTGGLQAGKALAAPGGLQAGQSVRRC